MAFRYRLVHHPKASKEYQDAITFFEGVDPGLAELFRDDFKAALRGIASGRAASTLYATGHTIRWVKLRRFSHKVFFEPEGDDVRFVLGVISGRRHPTRIRLTLGRRRRKR
jgi:hypothetical protein